MGNKMGITGTTAALGKGMLQGGGEPIKNQAPAYRVFSRMPLGCVLCELVFNELGQPVGYAWIEHNKAMERFLESEAGKCSRQAVEEFLRLFDWLPALTIACSEAGEWAWEQYEQQQQKWYSLAVFNLGENVVGLIIKEITARKSTELLLEQKRKHYEALLKQSSDAIAIVDAASKRIIEVNSQLCRLSGYSEHELVQMSIYQLLSDEERIIEVNSQLCRLSGYSEHELVQMSIYQLLSDEEHEIRDCQNELEQKRFLPVTTRWIKCKDGSLAEVERVGSLIRNAAVTLEVLTFYDVSEERRLQQSINEDAVLASQVQRQMLPTDFHSRELQVVGVYKPLHLVSGDFFDYRLSQNRKTLTGFVVDVAGHGLATALQTAAINVLLQDLILRERMPSMNELRQLNSKAMGYFDEGSFAALIIYHFDFHHRQLTCACCGINQFLTFCSDRQGWIKGKGSIIGIDDDPVFDLLQVPLQSGDCFYFLTDGLSDKLEKPLLKNLGEFSVTVGRLAGLADSLAIQDDCSAICIKIEELTDYCRYSFLGLESVDGLQKHIREKLESWTGNRSLHLEIILNEAINNVLFHGSGQGRFIIRRIGRHIVMRVKDFKRGFEVQSLLRPYASLGMEELAMQLLSQENGRGLLIMRLFSDRMLYSRSGSEVMLVCRNKADWRRNNQLSIFADSIG